MKKRVLILVILIILVSSFVIVSAQTETSGDKCGGQTRLTCEWTKIKDVIGSFFSNLVSGKTDCIKQRGIDAVRLVGLQGGYLNPDNYFENDIANVAYWHDSDNIAPSKSDIESEIASYLEATVPYCDNVNEDSVKSSVVINDNNVVINIKGNNEYNTKVPIRLGRVYDASSKIIDKVSENYDSPDLAFLGTDYSDLKITIVPYDSGIVYIITDDKSKIDDISYSLEFAVR